MNLIYSFVGLIMLMVFAILAFFVAWYIIVPLILISVCVWGARYIYQAFARYRTPKPDVQLLYPTTRSARSNRHNVIDVEYTEI